MILFHVILRLKAFTYKYRHELHFASTKQNVFFFFLSKRHIFAFVSDKLYVNSMIYRNVIFSLVIITASFFSCSNIPQGAPGPQAEALAQHILEQMNYEAWQNNTRAVSWSFPGGHRHFWDKSRGLVRVEWDNLIVLFDKNSMKGIAFREEVKVTDHGETNDLITKANEFFINDSYWLNPLFHIYSPGTVRSLVSPGVLKVHFETGGVTPGDTYVFYAGESDPVEKMRLWVSKIPIKGFSVSFTNYSQSSTGVLTARTYASLINIEIKDLVMYSAYPPENGEDLFEELEKYLDK